VNSGPLNTQETDHWSEDDLHELTLPEQPLWQRCGTVRCIEQGPWTTTLVCCMRKSEHEGEHRMTLGDVGTPEYWQESWE
jgi:hypothetical protein